MTNEYNTAPDAQQPSVGLVLEGGGLRAMFTSGVLDVFMKHGIRFDAAVGVSAGVLFGSNYKSEQPGCLFLNKVDFRVSTLFKKRQLKKNGRLALRQPTIIS